MKKNILYLLISIFGLVSCSSDDLINSTNTNDDTLLTKKISFNYSGKYYSSTYQQVNDSFIILSDTKINDLYQRLNQLPNLATYVDKNGHITYYDSFDSYLKETNINHAFLNGNSKAMLGNQKYKITFYSNAYNYLIFNLSAGSYKIHDLNEYQFNDNILLIKVKTLEKPITNTISQITLFRDNNFGGRSITFEFNKATSYQEIDLSEHLFDKSFLSTGKKWSRHVSSIIFNISYSK